MHAGCHAYVSSYMSGKGAGLDSLASFCFTLCLRYRVPLKLWESHLITLCLTYFPVGKIGNNNNTDEINYLCGPETQ